MRVHPQKPRSRGLGVLGALVLLVVTFAAERLYAGGFVPRFLAWIGQVPISSSEPAELPVVVLDLPHKSVQLLRFERERRLNMAGGEFTFTRGQIAIDGGELLSLRLRLKGDRRMHIEDEKRWSFRVRMRGSDLVFGMRNFSLQRPETRNYVYEWLYHQVLLQEGFPALQYRFVKLQLNGEDLGIYALEEHFDKHVLERNKFREGPILRFVETHAAPDLSRAAIAPFRQGSWSDGPRREMVEQAMALLDSFRRGERKVSDVFEREPMARFFAVADVLGVRHAAAWKSMRFYYNPLTAKLTPIGFDGHHGLPDQARDLSAELARGGQETNWLHVSYGPWFEALFSSRKNFDPQFFKAYVAELERMCAPSWLKALQDKHGATIDRLYAALERNGPLRADEIYHLGQAAHDFTFKPFQERCRAIPARLAPVARVHGFLDRVTPDSIHIAIGNAASLPVEVVGLKVGDAVVPPSGEPVVFHAKPEPAAAWNLPTYKTLAFKTTRVVDPLIIQVRVLGSSQIVETEVRPFRHLGPGAAGKLLAHLDQTAVLPCAQDSPRGECHLPAGDWTIQRSVALAPDTALVLAGGANLNLTEGASLLVRGPLRIEGTAEAPVRVHSSGRDGGGLVVLARGQLSVLRHVVFEGLGAPITAEAPGVTGAVTFYESPVEMEHVTFGGNRSEDALNVVRGELTCRHCKFVRIARDAIDVDFGSAELDLCEFEDVGNDAIDVSGTRALIRDVSMTRIGDKGVSAGEASQVTIERLRVERADVGVASKDESKVVARNLELDRVRQGLVVFQKKSEFGPASLRVTGVVLKDVVQSFQLERGSELIVDGSPVPASGRDLRRTLYPADQP